MRVTASSELVARAPHRARPAAARWSGRASHRGVERLRRRLRAIAAAAAHALAALHAREREVRPERPFLRAVPAAGLERRRHGGGLHRARTPVPVLEVEGEQPRVAGRQRATPAAVSRGGGPPGSAPKAALRDRRRRPTRPASRGTRASREGPRAGRAAGRRGRRRGSSRHAGERARAPARGGRAPRTGVPGPQARSPRRAGTGAAGASPRWSSGRGCPPGRPAGARRG